MSTPVATDQGTYAERVRAELADLPPTEQADLLAELDDHLAEVAAEGGTLADRLGPPEVYAAELRAAAGLPPRAPTLTPATPPARRGLADRVPPPVRELWVELRPGWWLLRGLLVAWSTTALVGGGLVLPVLAAIVLVPASILLGRWEAADRRVGLAVLVLTALALLTALAALAVGGRGYDYVGVPASDLQSGLPGVTNIHPYSADGKPLTDVLLYDQDGNPVLVGRYTPDGSAITVVPRYSADGKILDNVYPQEQTAEDLTVTVDSGEGQPRRRVTAPTVTPPALQPR